MVCLRMPTVRFQQESLSVFRKNPCPFSTGINVRFAQEQLSTFRKNRCPFCAGFCNFFPGSHAGAKNAAIMWSLMANCKFNDIDPFECLKNTLEAISGY